MLRIDRVLPTKEPGINPSPAVNEGKDQLDQMTTATRED
jgi:hypothetical protein